MQAEDPFDLDRFLKAQAPVFDQVVRELKSGRKESHWMWYVFPQLRGLGFSRLAQFYGFASIEEARAYLNHSVLGVRLVTTTQIVLDSKAGSLNELFGSPDDLKFCSSMTLYSEAARQHIDLFRQAIDRWREGKPDERTLRLLRKQAGASDFAWLASASFLCTASWSAIPSSRASQELRRKIRQLRLKFVLSCLPEV
jgi:uncharacterized protein (DUF1810 family)